MKHLLDYINHPEDANVNFALGCEYEQIGQTGAAISFYLRTAERTNNDLLQYESLLRMALCFGRQKTRDDTQRVLLQKALVLMPGRPEAYFLLARSYERQEQWHEGWLISSLGMKNCRWDHLPLVTNVEYPGHWGLLFEYGVCAWWVGHCEESRRIMFDLRYDCPLDDTHRLACERNLQTCGWPHLTLPYNPVQAPHIRSAFPGLEQIQRNYSQSLQDIFVLAANQGRREQWYLEVGSAEPFYNNNTALLEQSFGWHGISIDYDDNKVQQFQQQRRNPVICADATLIDYVSLLEQAGAPRDLGYLQIDCDPPENSYLILTRIPLDRYRFAVITFEHDYYANKQIRDNSRQYLKHCGYLLMAGDVAFDDRHSYEDWWIHPELVPDTVRTQLKDWGTEVKPADRYLFGSLT